MAGKRRSAAHPTAPAVRLALELNSQQKTNWCWAAVAVSIKKHYERDSTLTQCEHASMQLQPPRDCCSNPDACDETWFARNSLVGVGHFADARSNVHPPLTFEEIRFEIANGRPIVCGIDWTGGGHHYVVIDGYVNDSRALSVRDPSPERGAVEIPYDEFLNAYLGIGRWTEYFRTK